MFSVNDIHYARDQYLQLQHKTDIQMDWSQPEKTGLFRRLQRQLTNWATAISQSNDKQVKPSRSDQHVLSN